MKCIWRDMFFVSIFITIENGIELGCSGTNNKNSTEIQTNYSSIPNTIRRWNENWEKCFPGQWHFIAVFQ